MADNRVHLMKRFILRYGTFVLITLLLVGLSCLLHYVHIPMKQRIVLVHTPQMCKAYLPRSANKPTLRIDTLTVYQTAHGSFSFTIDSVIAEPMAMVLQLTPCDKSRFEQGRFGNTLLEGYIFVGQESLYAMLLRKLTRME